MSFSAVEHVRFERPHDVRVVVVEREAKVADPVVEQPVVAVVAAEHVAGEQDLRLHQVGALGVGPVQKRRMQEAQPAIAEADLVAGGDGLVVERFFTGLE